MTDPGLMPARGRCLIHILCISESGTHMGQTWPLITEPHSALTPFNTEAQQEITLDEINELHRVKHKQQQARETE